MTELLESIEAKLGFPVEIVSEGKARIVIPRMNHYRRPDGVFEPAWAPVFYNPRMAFNRDIAVVFARAYSKLKGLARLIVVEPLAGTGVRSIRYALEANAKVYASDIDSKAVKLAKVNIEINNVDGNVLIEKMDANSYMYRLRENGVRVDLVDIDPFGSPIPFIDAAAQVLKNGGVLAVTATDTAPLTGTYPHALQRKYDVIPGRTAWDKEQAVRILVGYIARRLAHYEYASRVLLAYYADHYVRAYIEVVRGAKRALETLKALSYGVYCPSCCFTGFTKQFTARCPYCHSQLVVVGPLYSGPLGDRSILEKMIEEVEKDEWITDKKRALKLLNQLIEEIDLPKPYYRLDRICSVLRRNMPKVADVISALKSRGFKAAKTHFDPRGFKTNAPHVIVVNTVLQLTLVR